MASSISGQATWLARLACDELRRVEAETLGFSTTRFALVQRGEKADRRPSVHGLNGSFNSHSWCSWPHRLMVRTLGFHPSNGGSIPPEVTKNEN